MYFNCLNFKLHVILLTFKIFFVSFEHWQFLWSWFWQKDIYMYNTVEHQLILRSYTQY